MCAGNPTAAPRPLDAILEKARQELCATDFALFEFYVNVYRPLCGNGAGSTFVTTETYNAWAPLMTFLEEKMHKLLPAHTQIFKREPIDYPLSDPILTRGIPEDLPPIHVYQLNACDWYAGADYTSCVRLYLDEMDGEEELLEDGSAVPLTDRQMEYAIFTDNSGDVLIDRSFREELDRLITTGVTFPVMFASTEF